MKTQIYIVLLLLMNFGGIVLAQNSNDSLIIAKIETEHMENNILFKPTVQNLSPLHFEYNYLLLIKKKDLKNNVSVNKQSGKFTLSPQETKVLSTSQIKQSENQNIKAYLYIRDENQNKLIAKDSLEFNNKNIAKVEETSLIMEGIVIDESKTKFGKDFYDAFYSVYNQYPKKFNLIITINEQPFRGRTSIVQINADQELVYEFFSNPDEDYTKQQVITSLNSIAAYAQNKEKLTKEFNF